MNRKSGHGPLPVGIIGLGERWRRDYAPALERLRRRFQVVGVCDQVHEQALETARALGCAAAAGPAELLADDGLEAVLYLDDQWYGCWPLELAGRTGKPLFCAVWPAVPDGPPPPFQEQPGPPPPVMVGLAPRLAPVTARLQALLRRLGPVRTVMARGRCRSGPEPLLTSSSAVGVVDWVLELFHARPSGILAGELAAGALASIQLEFSESRAAVIILTRAVRPGLHCEVQAEHGIIQVAFPSRLHWTSRGGRRGPYLPGRPGLVTRMLLRFQQAVAAGLPFAPGLDEVRRAWLCLQAAERSRADGRRQEIAAAQW